MYSKVLQKIVAEANITQEELSKKCKELGSPISRGQINKILNNKASAPDESISRTIAQVCNIDSRELVLEGYLEKAPKEFIEFLNKFQNILAELSLDFLDISLNDEQKDYLKEVYKKETLVQMILEILDSTDTVKIDSNSIKFENKENRTNITINDFSYISMEDDSMENKIPKGSKLKLEIAEKYTNGDIVLVKVGEQKLIRVLFVLGRDICIYPLNSKYKSLYLKKDDFKILARISSFEQKI